jgi:hypothetical protein
MFVKNNRGTSQLVVYLFSIAVRIPNLETSCFHEASDRNFNEGQIMQCIGSVILVPISI